MLLNRNFSLQSMSILARIAGRTRAADNSFDPVENEK
jgi:hypothetical protein